MKLKNAVLFDEKFYTAIVKLSKISLDIGDSILLAKTIKSLKDEGAIVFPIRDKIFDSFELDTKKLNFDKLSKEQELEFNSKIADLLNTEFEIPLSEKIKLDIKQVKGKYSADDLLTIDDIVEY